MDVNDIRDTLEARAERAIARARELGADQAEAGLSHDEGLRVTVRVGELESVERLL